MADFLTQLGRIIKHERIEEKLTQAQLAEKADISTRYLMDIENKNDIPSLRIFISLARVLKLSVDPLLYYGIYTESSETDKLIRLLSQCNKKQITVITSMVETMIEVDL